MGSNGKPQTRETWIGLRVRAAWLESSIVINGTIDVNPVNLTGKSDDSGQLGAAMQVECLLAHMLKFPFHAKLIAVVQLTVMPVHCSMISKQNTEYCKITMMSHREGEEVHSTSFSLTPPDWLRNKLMQSARCSRKFYHAANYGGRRLMF